MQVIIILITWLCQTYTTHLEVIPPVSIMVIVAWVTVPGAKVVEAKVTEVKVIMVLTLTVSTKKTWLDKSRSKVSCYWL